MQFNWGQEKDQMEHKVENPIEANPIEANQVNENEVKKMNTYDFADIEAPKPKIKMFKRKMCRLYGGFMPAIAIFSLNITSKMHQLFYDATPWIIKDGSITGLGLFCVFTTQLACGSFISIMQREIEYCEESEIVPTKTEIFTTFLTNFGKSIISPYIIIPNFLSKGFKKIQDMLDIPDQ